jgi:2-polyprenyl-6-methoxyphenol hydroxylase-like FAD-dependent oxidoreductase
LGGELRVNERCREQSISDGTVIASGRRPHPVESGWRWFGLKIHARGLPLAADLEMHCVPNGYVGVNRIDNGEFNVCGLFRKPAQAAGEKTEPRDLLRGPKQTLLRQRLEAAHFDEASFCSVAGLSLRPYRAAGSDECCIGDALTMTPPVTGNGMSMAFESAEIATEPLAAYSAGQMSWPEAQRIIATRCDEAFGTRLAWASRLQWMMFSPLFRGWLGLLALRSDWLWRLFFAKTR